MANNMHYYKMGLNLVGDFANKCLGIIKKQIEQMPDGHLHFNYEEYMYLSENEDGKIVPFMHQFYGEDVELYSYDGWIKPEDIGNWADVAIQIVKDIKKGNATSWGYEKGYLVEKSYSVFHKYGDEANDYLLTKDEAMKLAEELEDNEYEVIVAKFVDGEWQTIYETETVKS